jgi:hypothetical protein
MFKIQAFEMILPFLAYLKNPPQLILFSKKQTTLQLKELEEFRLINMLLFETNI